MRHILLALLININLFAQTLHVAVAANMSYAIQDIITTFEQLHPQIKVQTTIGGSGKLTAQILHGAPYDIFLSANMFYPQQLHEQQITSKPKVYAQGALILLSSTKQDFSDIKSLLKSPKIQKIAVANPKTAPYGAAAFEAMKNMGILNQVRAKFVYAESISQTLTYTLKAADIGIVAKSAIFTPNMPDFKKGINYLDIPTSLYTPIQQGAALISRQNKDAQLFYDFLFDEKTQTILRRYGYILP